MILQCAQCKTRFRLDDSKLKPGGVKVRCSKCRHVFIAGAETAPEESEFDAILAGLGAPAPAKEEAPPAQQPSLSEAGYPEEPVASHEQPSRGQEAVPEPPPTQAEPGFGEVSFAEPAAPPVAPAPAEKEVTLDFGEFSFDEAPSEAAPTPAPAGEEPVDFSAFAFEDEAAAPKASAPAAESDDFSAFAFEEEPAPPEEAAAPTAGTTFEFDEFAFDEEPAVTKDSSEGTLDFGALSFDEEEPPQTSPAPAAEVGAIDFGAFAFEEETAVPQEPPAPAAAEAVLDFGEFSFDETPPAPQAAAAPAEAKELDFDAFSFEEEPVVPAGPEPSAAPQAVDFGELSFEPEPPASPEPAEAKPPAAASEPLDFGAFSFDEEPVPPQPAATTPVEEKPAGAAPVLGRFEGTRESGAPAEKADIQPTAAESTALKEKPDHDFALDFGPSLFGPAMASKASAESAEAEEAPPLSIASRRQGRSLLTISLVAISVVMVVGLSVAGFYLMQSGPAAFEKLGLGFIAKWIGMESVEEGRITIKNPLASFHQNKEAGELFVVTGEAVNSFKKARASIHVKVTLYDKKGNSLLQKTAYCGNKLTSEQLATLPMAKLDAIMNNQFGDSLSNLGVQPGRSIPFVVAIAQVPKEAADFGVEAIGSTVAGQ